MGEIMSKADYDISSIESGYRVTSALCSSVNVAYTFALLAVANPNSDFARSYFAD